MGRHAAQAVNDIAKSMNPTRLNEATVRTGTVHHGTPRNLLPFRPNPAGGYLAFLGRIAPEKRPDRAIEIAARSGSWASRSPTTHLAVLNSTTSVPSALGRR
jgi:hypothetical protein